MVVMATLASRLTTVYNCAIEMPGHGCNRSGRGRTRERCPSVPQSTTASFIPEYQKCCVKCGRLKPASQFFKRSSAKDGLASYCKDCQRDYHRNWKHENLDKVHAEGKAYRLRHQEAVRQKNARWRQDNREHHKELIQRWEQAHPDRVAAKYLRYRQRHPEKFKAWQDDRRDSGRRQIANLVRRGLERNQSIPGHLLTLDTMRGRFAVLGWRCFYCETPLNEHTAEADHRIPLSRGGLNCGANIVPCCRSCNARKSNMTEAEFRARLASTEKGG